MRGHFLFPTAEKGSKTAAGVPPDPRGSCRFSLQENLPGGIMKTDDKKKGCGPGDWGLCAFSVPRPIQPREPRAPSLYGLVRVFALPPAFLKRKSASHPGVQGAPPWHVFAVFLRVKKEGGPQARLLLRYVRV